MVDLSILKSMVDKEITNSDIVLAVMYKTNLTEICKDSCSLQKFFYEAKQKEPSLFENFSFDISGIHPFSDELDATLFRLEVSEIFSVLKPSYNNTFIDNKDLLEISYNKFSDSDRIKINNISTLFAVAEESEK